MGWVAEELGFDCCQGQEVFLFSITFKLAMGPTQPTIQWVSGALPGVKQQGCEGDHSPVSVAKIKNDGAIPPLPDTSSWHGA
jgi:hypothetical protein